MNTTASPQSTTAQNEVVIERTFNAPRALVWKAWTDPNAFKAWWGPKNFTATVKKLDAKTGGSYHYGMIDANGKIYWGAGRYTEVTPMDRIVYTDSFADEDGNIVSASYYGMPEMPLEMQVIIEFEDAGKDKTKMTLRHVGLPPNEMGDMAKVGWNESFDKLEASIQ